MDMEAAGSSVVQLTQCAGGLWRKMLGPGFCRQPGDPSPEPHGEAEVAGFPGEAGLVMLLAAESPWSRGQGHIPGDSPTGSGRVPPSTKGVRSREARPGSCPALG